MNVRKFLLCGLAVGALTTGSLLQAQDGKGKGRGQMTPEARVAQLDQALTLTAEQKTKITAILAKAQEDTMALPQDQRREKGMEIRTAANKDIRALLTDAQKAKFDAMPPAGNAGGKKKKDQ